MTTLHDIQMNIEQSCVMAGIARFRTRNTKAVEQGRPEDGDSCIRLIKTAVEPVAGILQAMLDDASSGRPGRHHSAVPFLSHLTPDQCAFLTGRTVFHEALTHGGRRRVQRMILAIGRAVITEALAADFAKAKPKDYASAVTKAKKSSTSRRSRTVLLYCAHQQGMTEVQWPEQIVQAVGYALLEAFINGTGLAEYRQNATNTAIGFIEEVCLTPACAEWLRNSDAALELARPMHAPMVVPPKPWTSPYGGGYLAQEMRAGCGIHTHISGFKADLKAHWHHFENHFAAVNAYQNVAWRINPTVLSVAAQVWQQGGGLTDCIPSKSPEALPPKPQDIDTNEAARRAWRKSAAKVYEREGVRMSNALSAGRTIKTAEEYAQFESMFFPCYCDFRGRLYTMQTDLSPQGCDLAKGLLDFAKGEPVKSDLDIFWCAVNGANIYGIDKVSFEDRVQWVQDHEADIRLSVADPLGAGQAFWMAADGGGKAWQFLAWAAEWVSILDNGFGTMTHRRVDLDGSCNGLQHFAALLKDRKTAVAVNLTATDTPNDLYGLVASNTMLRLESLFTSPDLDADGQILARQWHAWGVTRKMAKRPVMVLPYGGTISSTRSYIKAAYKEGVEKQGKPDYFAENLGKAVAFLSSLMWQAMTDELPAAMNAMKWLQGTASACSKKNIPIRWTAPSGFIVHQAYPDLEEYRVKLYTPASIMKAKPRQLTMLGPTEDGKLNKRQQRQGVSPNFVHSLDASHLVAIVKGAIEAGIDSFALVHDSYGTLATRTEDFFKVIREAFVTLYSSDVMETYRQSIERVTEEAIESAPMTGDYDVLEILDADYAFS